MGIVNETASFLWDTKRSGVSFENTLTLGRHALYADRRVLRRIGREARAGDVTGPWADDFFRKYLGATALESVDHSAYEGATITHDLNIPVPVELHGRYDVVFDGGALEHIFNFPVALASCMKMVKTGGHLILAVPANNQLGHGFYQFSPELFYRTLSIQYGYTIERMVALEHRYMGAEFGTRGPLYDVADPARVGSRVSLMNSHPLGLLILARTTDHRADLFAPPPQQSDYVQQWQTAALPVEESLAHRAVRLLPSAVRVALRNRYDTLMVHSLRNRRFFSPINTK
jgi:SAM-dependent methyltransferase